jgi:hypothetical protein
MRGSFRLVIQYDHLVRAAAMISRLLSYNTGFKKKKVLFCKTYLFPACGQEAVGESGRENVPAYSGLCYPGGCSQVRCFPSSAIPKAVLCCCVFQILLPCLQLIKAYTKF